MPDEKAVESRTVVQFSVGTRITTLIAALFLVAAGYMYLVPLNVPSTTGGPFGCQSAKNPPKDGFPKSICGNINKVYLYRAEALLVAALLVGGGGLLLFGVRRTETRPVGGQGARRAGAGPDR